jgi:transposase
MATIQARKSRGRKYWYIVESRRINGKPRPITLAYLGKADDLLKRLTGLTENIKLKSYSHGAVAALLSVAQQLDVCNIINKHVKSRRSYVTKQPIRNNLTAGATLLLAAIGRVCQPTSKDGWAAWAKTTSLSYLLRISLNKIDSQHFWDLMDAVPEGAIEKIEEDLIRLVFQKYSVKTDTLFYDTTNFFTYIHTTNNKCDVAKRGRNKQKRNDLRQVGLALVVSKKEKIPLFHLTYEGNRHDSKIFSQIVEKIKVRLEKLGLLSEQHTIVFDRGNNSKDNFKLLTANGLHYVGALVPYQHKSIVNNAIDYLSKNNEETLYRTQQTIWGEKRTVVVFISDCLKASQLNWLYKSVNKIKLNLHQLQTNIVQKKQTTEKVEQKIVKIMGKYATYFNYDIKKLADGKHQLNFVVDDTRLEKAENECGIRILISNRHNWSSRDIVEAYHGQSQIEHSFRDLKDPYNLAVRPQYHWTDQKIKVHFFICVLGYLLTTLLRIKAQEITGCKYELGALIRELNGIRLATMLEDTKTQGKMKAHYRLEEMNKSEAALAAALLLENVHKGKIKIDGFGVYT